MNAQIYNRYSYCLNNPLTYTDWTNGGTQAQGVTISNESSIAYVLTHPESIVELREVANSGKTYVELFEDAPFWGTHLIEAVYCIGKRKQWDPSSQGADLIAQYEKNATLACEYQAAGEILLKVGGGKSASFIREYVKEKYGDTTYTHYKIIFYNV